MSLIEKPKRLHLLITAGPTREKIDPIRFISNYSTGRFGYEIAKEAKKRGHTVTLVSGPSSLEPPKGVGFIRVESAAGMRRAVLKEFPKSDCLIMAAAVSDWRVSSVKKRKIKRGPKIISLELSQNPDILAELGNKKEDKLTVGFALETEDLDKNALKKLRAKKLDLIIANRLERDGNVFNDNYINILIMDRLGNRTQHHHKSKRELAKIILDKIEEFNI